MARKTLAYAVVLNVTVPVGTVGTFEPWEFNVARFKLFPGLVLLVILMRASGTYTWHPPARSLHSGPLGSPAIKSKKLRQPPQHFWSCVFANLTNPIKAT